MSDANEIWERAFRLHQQGKLREAFLRYDAIVKATPGHAPALHYSGVVLYQSGKFDAAIERIRASLAVDPSEADAWSNLAIALRASGRQEAALAAFAEAARLVSNLVRISRQPCRRADAVRAQPCRSSKCRRGDCLPRTNRR